MIIRRSIDIEDEVRKALSDYMTAYCRPLPEDFVVPCVLIQQVGGADESTIDTFEVVIDARAEDEAEALETLRNAEAIIKETAALQTTALRYAETNSSGSWGVDPLRQDLAMCSARLRIVAHRETAKLRKRNH